MRNGVINIYKEQGFTSHDVVAKLRGILKQKKIGHTGTLDPDAEGVLPVCLGSGTKLCDMLTDRDKTYEAVLLLGQSTDTQDAAGTVLEQAEVSVTEEMVREAVLSFTGDYEQIPPMYSALKVDGKKLYELARAGREVERKARTVKIAELEILECRLPVVRMRVVCSKGTYIRTLCADIGTKIGCGGTMKSLRRTRVGKFMLENAITLSGLQQLKNQERLTEAVLPVDSVFEDCPALHVSAGNERFLDNGNAIYPGQILEHVCHEPGRWVRFYRMEGSFAGIYAYDEQKQWYRPVKMFL